MKGKGLISFIMILGLLCPVFAASPDGDESILANNIANFDINAYVRKPLDHAVNTDVHQIRLFDAMNSLGEMNILGDTYLDPMDTSAAGNQKFHVMDNFVTQMYSPQGAPLATLEWRGLLSPTAGDRRYSITWKSQGPGDELRLKEITLCSLTPPADTVVGADRDKYIQDQININSRYSIPFEIKLRSDRIRFESSNKAYIGAEASADARITTTAIPNGMTIHLTNDTGQAQEWSYEGTFTMTLDKEAFANALSGKYREVIVFDISTV